MKYLITGGTGTLGQALVAKLYDKKDTKITILSRDELKQQEMRRKYPEIRYIIGDIRDYMSVKKACEGQDVVIHTAALKHIDVIESNPFEAVRTNIVGTENVMNAAEAKCVKHVVFCSTDKAVDPLNIYGMTKGIAEKMILGRNNTSTPTKYHAYRWGNILMSRGSALYSFVETLKNQRCVYLTSTGMSRFWLRIDDAAEFLLSTFESDDGKGVRVPPMKGAKLTLLVQAIAEILEIKVYEVIEIGLRPGEKLAEDITSRFDDCYVNSSNCKQYTLEQLKDLIRLEVLELV